MWSWCYEKLAVNDPVYVAAGRYKGKNGHVLNKGITQCRVLLSHGRIANIVYTNIEEADRSGKPKESPILDMTGRTMKIGDLIACVGDKRQIEICRIIGGNYIDGIKIETVIRQGKKPIPNMWTLNQRTMGNPTINALKLPVDDTTFIMWKLKDYEFD
jgi:hypothetical protein